MSFDFKKEEDVKAYIKNIGIEYRFGCYKEKKPEVCHLLADYLEAISKDYDKAGRVYKTNCDDCSFPKSCYKTACYYINGKGPFKKSSEKAYEYFEKGCKLKDAESCFRSGILAILDSKSANPKQSFSQGIGHLTKGCEGKHSGACHHLSAIYMDGDPNSKVLKDMKLAFKYAIKGCEYGNIYSCVNVSQMYKRGEGVEQNMVESEKFRKKAVDLAKELNQNRTLNFQEGLAPT